MTAESTFKSFKSFNRFKPMNRDPGSQPGFLDLESTYRAPWWLPGGHLQTIYARSLARNYAVHAGSAGKRPTTISSMSIGSIIRRTVRT